MGSYIYFNMLPKLQNSPVAMTLRKENPTTHYHESDRLKNILGHSENENYKPWKDKMAPKNPHSPFGDFPKDYISK